MLFSPLAQLLHEKCFNLYILKKKNIGVKGVRNTIIKYKRFPNFLEKKHIHVE